jgi:hypothetical protein
MNDNYIVEKTLAEYERAQDVRQKPKRPATLLARQPSRQRRHQTLTPETVGEVVADSTMMSHAHIHFSFISLTGRISFACSAKRPELRLGSRQLGRARSPSLSH